jgi:hypothetical protein
MSPGEEKAWEALRKVDPDDVCARTGATFDRISGLYRFRSFGKDFSVSPQDRKIFSDVPESDTLLQRLGFFFNFSAVCSFYSAKDVPLTGKLISPLNMKSGQLFFRGSHVLPLDRVSERYSNDRNGFLKRGLDLGGVGLEYGDASLRLFPLPRVPVVLILWLADEEFPPRTDILFDSSAEIQLPIDVIWSIAMLSLLVML